MERTFHFYPKFFVCHILHLEGAKTQLKNSCWFSAPLVVPSCVFRVFMTLSKAALVSELKSWFWVGGKLRSKGTLLLGKNSKGESSSYICHV